jgi:CBS domain containing-hemolysin-like protein
MRSNARRESEEDAASSPDSAPQSASRSSAAREGLMERLRLRLRGMLFFPTGGELKEAIAEALEENPETAHHIPPEEKTILKNVLNFSEKSVRDIMIPRSQIQAIEYGATLEEIKRIVGDKSHTRIPVYKETLDNVKGFIHVKDLFPIVNGDAVFDMALLIRDVLFVPPSMRVLDLLVKMRLSRVHMAIVVDEYGGTDGLVTMEDLFEEIVGEIQDEHDEGEVGEIIKWSPQHTVDVDGKAEIGRLEKALGLDLHEEGEDESQYDTLGGLIFFLSGRVPSKGEKIAYRDGIMFEVLDSDARKIKRVRILRQEPQA